jgi:hypothetical protein
MSASEVEAILGEPSVVVEGAVTVKQWDGEEVRIDLNFTSDQRLWWGAAYPYGEQSARAKEFIQPHENKP